MTTLIERCRLLLIALVLSCLAPFANAAGACSPSVGGVVLNEYAHQLNYAELKRLNAAINITGWKIRIYPNSSTYYEVTPSNSNSGCSSPTYYTSVFSSSQTPTNADVVLLDSNNDVVDILRVRTAAMPVSSNFYSPVPACSYLSPPTDIQIDSSRKGVDRTPDGVGQWRNTPGTGSGSFTSPCTGNTPNQTTVDLKTTKTASVSSLLLGGNVTFTVTVLNNSSTTTTASAIVVSEALPSGLSYASHSIVKPAATSSTYSSSTGLWSISALAKGESATLTLVATATSVGTLTNTATAYSDNIEATAADNTQSASVNVVIPTLTVSASPTSVSLGGTTIFTITVTNPLAGQTATGFKVTNVLDSGLSFVSVVAGSPSAGSYNSATGEWTLASLAGGASATLQIQAQVNASGTWADTATVTMNGYTGLPASATVSSTASGFNAWINADKTISTQLVGDAISLTVGAFDSAVPPNPASFTGNITVELEYCTNVSRTSGGGISCGGTWSPVPGISKVASFSNTTTAFVTLQALPNAYEIVRVKLTPPSGTVVYASDLFAVRPSSLSLTATDLDWEQAGSARSLTTGAPTVTHKAGRPFSVQLWSAASGYPGTLLSVTGLEPIAALTPPANSIAGTFSAGTWSVLSDSAATRYGMQSSTATYSEVGNIAITLEDRHFADIDTADSTTAQRYVAGSATLGRFVPNHLTTTVTQGCSTAYTYSGQPFSVQVQAFAFGATVPVQNYEDNAGHTVAGFSKLVTLSKTDSSTTNFSGNTIAATSFSKGAGTASAVVYTLFGTPLSLTIRATDQDSVTSSGATEGATEIRSGRLWLANAYGSELLALPVPMQTQYWTTNGWVLNTADSCTTLTVPTSGSGLSNSLAGSTTASLAAPVVSGKVSFRLSAPTGGSRGLVDIDGSNVRGSNTWLALSMPTARACFGVCGPRSPVIYLRERF